MHQIHPALADERALNIRGRTAGMLRQASDHVESVAFELGEERATAVDDGNGDVVPARAKMSRERRQDAFSTPAEEGVVHEHQAGQKIV